MTEAEPTALARRYYRLDSTRIPYRDYWNMTGPASFVIAAILKSLRVRLPLQQAIPWSEQLIPVEREAIPAAAWTRMEPMVTAFEGAGFEFCFAYTEPLISPDSMAVGLAMLSADRLTHATIIDTTHQLGNAPPTVQTARFLISRTTDGRVLVTGWRVPDMSGPPEYELEVLRDGTPDSADEMVAHHQARLARREVDSPYRAGLPAVAYTPSELPDVVLEHSQRQVEFNASRGVYVPMSDAEVTALRKRPANKPVVFSPSPWTMAVLTLFFVLLFSVC